MFSFEFVRSENLENVKKRERERENEAHSEAKRWKPATRDSYRIGRTRVSGHNTALRFPNKAPSVYTRSVANTLQLSYKRIGRGGEESGRLYSGSIIRGGVHERNRGEFLAMVGAGRAGKRTERESRRRESESARVLICHRSLRGPFRILDQRESYANPSLSLPRIWLFGGKRRRRWRIAKDSMSSIDSIGGRSVCL